MTVRYAYGISAALLLAGSAATLTGIGPAGAQTAANDSAVIRNLAPRAGAPMSFADLTEQLQPAVVNISTTQRVRVSNNNPFAGTPFDGLFGNRQGGGGGEQTREAQSLGSGFIISADGYVVTNNHVVAPGNRNATIESITVIMPDRTEYEAELVGRDAASDIAVLKIKANKPFPFVKFGDSASARVGDWVIAIGNPFGLGGTVTTGILSAIHRNTGQGGAYDRFLQTDASINRGNSGGPMFDLNGNVIGINNAIISPTGGNVGIGFAIPAEVAAPIVETLKKGRTIERGYLGVQISALSEDLADSLGLEKNRGEFVQRVEPGEAAQKAGIQAGDVITKVNGKTVTPDQTLSYLVANLPIGTNVPIELVRDGKTIKVNAKLGTRPSEEELAGNSFDPDAEDNALGQEDNGASAQATAEALGLSVVDLTPAIARQIGVASTQKGVVVSTVDPSSDAAQKGIKRGFLITSVNRQPVNSAADLDSAINSAKRSNRGAVLLQIRRGARDPQFVAVRLQES
ncbi:Do family serine endopeptidase [Parasphingorhabdus sp.]|uniref:Do family serine endopeptidase n=1 Tax=Parasphingorhabdus sp. TaxID=2709688 RepID=UPI002B26A58C|nr:Do family serine endopeptidase [Parasphingorhabdus sp.]|tara:strand:+ start:434 stop:1981 length:1548 start_codon:yes stop_codon:yes gene_type:complete